MTKAGMMRIFLALLVISSVALSGCSRLRDSRINPGNWFGKSKVSAPSTQQTADGAEVNPLIPEQTSIFRKDKREIYFGTPVDQVTEMKIERLPTGAIVHVTGVSLRQGAHDVRLTSKANGDPVDGVLTLTLEAVQPQDQPQGTQITRTIHAARFVSNDDLDNSRVIQVLGGRNSVTSKR